MSGAPSNQACLTVLGGTMSGTQFVIEEAVDDVLIGSDSTCKFCIPLPGVSPVHARIWLDASGATVHDTDSPRGLYVNDDRVNGQAPLKNGDILWLGTPGEDAVVMLQCRLPRPAAAPEPPATLLAGEATEVLTTVEEVPPAASEFYVEVDNEAASALAADEAPAETAATSEPPPVEATIVLARPSEEAGEPVPEEPPLRLPPELTPPPLPPPSALETEFEDETLVELAPVPPPAPAPAPSPAPQPEAVEPKAEPVSAAPAPKPPEPTPVPKPPPPSLPVAAPRPAPARPAPAPPPAPRPRPTPAASPVRGIVLGAGLLALFGVGGFFAWRWLHPTRTVLVRTTPSPPPPTLPAATLPVAPPETTLLQAAAPTPEAPVEEVVTIVKQPSPKAPSPSPSAGKPTPSPKAVTPAPVAAPAGPSPEELRAQQTAAEVAGLLGQAEAAAAAARHEEALRLYDEVLKLDPQNARAAAGRATAHGAASASRRRFAAGRTSVQSGKSKGGDLSGFDSSDVEVLDAPGQILFEVAPASVKPGDTFSVKIYFQNDAKKVLRVKSLSVGTLANGARSGGPVTPRAREVAPQQRALVEEISGVWKDETSTWSVDVSLVSDRNDTYRNQVSWK